MFDAAMLARFARACTSDGICTVRASCGLLEALAENSIGTWLNNNAQVTIPRGFDCGGEQTARRRLAYACSSGGSGLSKARTLCRPGASLCARPSAARKAKPLNSTCMLWLDALYRSESVVDVQPLCVVVYLCKYNCFVQGCSFASDLRPRAKLCMQLRRL